MELSGRGFIRPFVSLVDRATWKALSFCIRFPIVFDSRGGDGGYIGRFQSITSFFPRQARLISIEINAL